MADLPERKDMLPDNAGPLERAIAKTEARIDAIDMDLVRRVRSVDEAEEGFLTYQAYERSVDVWRPTWPIDIKRAVIRVQPKVQAHKGGLASVSRALGAQGLNTRIVEWWQTTPRGIPYTFLVTAFATVRYRRTGPLITPELTRDALATVDANAPLSRAFEFRIGAEIHTSTAAAIAGSAYGLTTPTVRARPITRTHAKGGAAVAGSAFGLTTPWVRARPFTGIGGRVVGTFAGRAVLALGVGGVARALTATGAGTGAGVAGRGCALATPSLVARPATYTAAQAAAAAAGRGVIVITARMEATP